MCSDHSGWRDLPVSRRLTSPTQSKRPLCLPLTTDTPMEYIRVWQSHRPMLFMLRPLHILRRGHPIGSFPRSQTSLGWTYLFQTGPGLMFPNLIECGYNRSGNAGVMSHDQQSSDPGHPFESPQPSWWSGRGTQGLRKRRRSGEPPLRTVFDLIYGAFEKLWKLKRNQYSLRARDRKSESS